MTKEATPEKPGRILQEESADEIENATLDERKLRQPDTLWSWVVCISGSICMSIVLGCGYCFGIIFPSLLDEFKRGKSRTGEYR